MRSIPGTPLLSPLLLARASVPRSGGFPPGVRSFAYGRYALAAYVEETKAPLFAPAFVCAEATELLEASDHPVHYYPVEDDLTPDWAWLEANAGNAGGVLLLVHYFGFPNAVTRAVEFAAQHEWTMLEDCAHSFLTQHQGQVVGTFGDAGVYSYRKMLPLPDGAGLVLRKPTNGKALAIGGASSAGAVARALTRYVLYRSGVPRSLWARMGNRQDAVASVADTTSPRAMSGQSLRLMAALAPSFDRITATRRANYRRLSEAFTGFPEIQLPYPVMPEGTCPYLFPVLLSERDAALSGLRDLGVPAGTWPVLPPVVAGASFFETTHRYTEHLLTLPVHQDLSLRDMDAMVTAYQRVRGG